MRVCCSASDSAFAFLKFKSGVERCVWSSKPSIVSSRTREGIAAGARRFVIVSGVLQAADVAPLRPLSEDAARPRGQVDGRTSKVRYRGAAITCLSAQSDSDLVRRMPAKPSAVLDPRHLLRR